jgi:hypothetical protein
MNTWYMAVPELNYNDKSRRNKPTAATAEDNNATKP